MTNITNAQRVQWAEHAIRHYCFDKDRRTFQLYDTPDTVLTDLLCDLIHYAAANNISFTECMTTAEGHYAEERAEAEIEFLIDNGSDMIALLRRAHSELLFHKNKGHDDTETREIIHDIDTMLATLKTGAP